LKNQDKNGKTQFRTADFPRDDTKLKVKIEFCRELNRDFEKKCIIWMKKFCTPLGFKVSIM